MQQELESVSKLIDSAIAFGIEYGFQIIGALIVLFVGLKVSNWAGARIAGFAQAKGLDPTLSGFIGNIVRIVLIGFVIIVTLGNFGISVTPLIALAGAAAFGATMAIQGPLSNYGAGLSIIMARPFTVGNTVTLGKISGVVDKVALGATVLTGEDNERIIVPNKEIVGRIIINSQDSRVVETRICVATDTDVDKATAAIRAALKKVPEVQNEPRIQAGVHDFTYGGLVLGLRFWVPGRQYFEVRYRANQAVLEALRAAGIEPLKPGATAVALGSLSADDEAHPDD